MYTCSFVHTCTPANEHTSVNIHIHEKMDTHTHTHQGNRGTILKRRKTERSQEHNQELLLHGNKNCSDRMTIAIRTPHFDHESPILLAPPPANASKSQECAACVSRQSRHLLSPSRIKKGGNSPEESHVSTETNSTARAKRNTNQKRLFPNTIASSRWHDFEAGTACEGSTEGVDSPIPVVPHSLQRPCPPELPFTIHSTSRQWENRCTNAQTFEAATLGKDLILH